VRPSSVVPAVDLEEVRSNLSKELGDIEVDDEDLCGALMYPKVFTDYAERHLTYGPVRTLPTRAFFYGMEPGDEISAEIDPGKTLEIRLQAVGEPHDDGLVRVFFELNGQPRKIAVPDRSIAAGIKQTPKADPDNASHVPAPMPGIIANVVVKEGQAVSRGDLLVTIEAMKMETGIHAEQDGTVETVHISAGSQVDAKDLLLEIVES